MPATIVMAEVPYKEYASRNTFYSWFVVVLAGTGGMLLGYDNGTRLKLPMSQTQQLMST